MTGVAVLTDAKGTFATLREAFGVDDDSPWWLPFNVFLARTPDGIVLVDTGVGPPSSEDRFLPERDGLLPEALTAAGVAPADIDLVVLTHLHPDHVGWNMLDGKPFFPNARYVAHRADYDTFTKARPDRPYIRDQLIGLEAAGRLELLDEARSPFPGVEIEHVPGHTSGHCIVTAAGVTILGDLAVHELQLADPDLAYVFEEDAAQAAAARRTVLGRFADSGSPVGFAHLGLGRVERIADGFAWVPLAEETGATASN